eukprot:8618306-Pyramimonas_sp.AAC.1
MSFDVSKSYFGEVASTMFLHLGCMIRSLCDLGGVPRLISAPSCVKESSSCGTMPELSAEMCIFIVFLSCVYDILQCRTASHIFSLVIDPSALMVSR